MMPGRLATLITTLAVVTAMSGAGAAQNNRDVTEADCVSGPAASASSYRCAER